MKLADYEKVVTNKAVAYWFDGDIARYERSVAELKKFIGQRPPNPRGEWVVTYGHDNMILRETEEKLADLRARKEIYSWCFG